MSRAKKLYQTKCRLTITKKAENIYEKNACTAKLSALT